MTFSRTVWATATAGGIGWRCSGIAQGVACRRRRRIAGDGVAPSSAGVRRDRWAAAGAGDARAGRSMPDRCATHCTRAAPAACGNPRRSRRSIVRELATAGICCCLDRRMLARQRAQRRARPDFEQHAALVSPAAAAPRRRTAPARAGGAPSSPRMSRSLRIAATAPVAVEMIGMAARERVTACHFRAERRDHRIHHRRVEGVRGAQRAARDAVGFELRLERRRAPSRPGHHAAAGRILRRQRQRRRAARASRSSSASRTDSMPPAGCACISAPRRATSRSASAQRQHAGQRRGDELADAVADQRRRHDARGSSTAAPARTRCANIAGCMIAVGSSACGSSANTRSRRSKPSSPASASTHSSNGRAERRLAGIQPRPCRRTARPAPGTGRPRRGCAPVGCARRRRRSRACRSAATAPPRSPATTARRCAKALRPTRSV